MPQQSIQCHAHTRKGLGSRCKNHTRTNNMFCAIHLNYIDGLAIRPSQIPGAGFGLYTTKDDKKGQNICKYTGKIITGPEADESDSKYLLEINRNHIIDAQNPLTSAVGRWANDARNSGFRNNSRFSFNRRNYTASIKASHNIKAGSEIFVPYGRTYWSRHSNV